MFVYTFEIHNSDIISSDGCNEEYIFLGTPTPTPSRRQPSDVQYATINTETDVQHRKETIPLHNQANVKGAKIHMEMTNMELMIKE